MKIREDRSHMNIDTRWFEKGYAKEDVHSLRLQSLCTEAEAAANKQFYDSHTCEEWEQYIRQASLESSAAMKPVMEAIAQDFVCYQYDENIPVSYTMAFCHVEHIKNTAANYTIAAVLTIY